jgi:serine protease Do
MKKVQSIFVAAALAFISGCATTQDEAGRLSLMKPFEDLNTSSFTDAFSAQMRGVKGLVDAGKFAEAEQFVLTERAYFTQRLVDRGQPLPSELQRLGDEVWTRKYAARTGQAIAALAAIAGVADRAHWEEQTIVLRDAVKLSASLDEDFTLLMLRKGTVEQTALKDSLVRVMTVVVEGRQQALALTFDEVLATGHHPSSYPGAPFSAADYVASEPLQALAVKRLAGLAERVPLLEEAAKLGSYLSEASRATVDRQFIAVVRKELWADGRISLEELAAVQQLRTPFGSASDAWSGLVRIGHVILGRGSPQIQGSLDFDVPLKQDLPFGAVQAEGALLHAADLGGYDYLLVTDVAQAKISRDFKSKNAVNSRRQTGERQEQNPAYIGAMSAYEQAMAEYRRVQINAALPRNCSGWGCVLHGIADGLTQSMAQKKVDEASQVLAQTSRTVSIPVYSAYDYELVDVDVVKTAEVHYYIVDVKGRHVVRNSFRLNDQETFRIAYNVHAEDPDHRDIQSRTSTEADLSEWEKLHLELPMSALLGGKTMAGAGTAIQSDLPTFLASLDLRRLPTQASGRGREWERDGRQDAQGGMRREPVAAVASADAGAVSQTIADDRFDSVVVIRNASATGTGFYVTPDLVLTAYHVVRGSSLAQLSFYDGSKTTGRVVHHDVRLDLALVRAQTPGRPLKIHTGPLRLGEAVEAIGHPKGYEFTITRGVISALRKQRSANIGSEALVEFVQTDTPISAGNSGGPLLQRDVVIGVNDWIRVDKGSQNLNFSVSYNEIRSFMDRFHHTPSAR